MKKCVHCGNDIPDSSNFCPYCGSNSGFVQQPIQPNVGTPYPQPNGQQDKTKTWLIAIIVALFVAILAIGCALLYLNQKHEIEIQEQQEVARAEADRAELDRAKQETEQAKQEAEQAKEEAQKAVEKSQNEVARANAEASRARAEVAQIPRADDIEVPASATLTGILNGESVCFDMSWDSSGDNYSGTFSNYNQGVTWLVTGTLNARRMYLTTPESGINWTFTATGDGRGHYNGHAKRRGGSSYAFHVSL